MSKYEERSPLLSNFSMEWVKRKFPTKGRKIVMRNLDKVETMNIDRVESLVGSNKICLYVVNHQSILDYSVPMYSIIDNRMPYPRSVAGANLNNWIIRNAMADIGKWGVIWFDRNNKSPEHIKEYLRAVRQTYEEGFSVLGFPEAGRNRNIGGDPLPFKEAFFGAILRAQKKIDRPIYVVNMAVDYSNGIPEERFFEKMDRGGDSIVSDLAKYIGQDGRVTKVVKALRYFGWDSVASMRWKYLNGKGTARVNYGEPIRIDDLAGKGGKKKAAERSRDKVIDLLNEARVVRMAA
jgi:1-acyl-sn-glycerol-3-phosphate acyltransferase